MFDLLAELAKNYINFTYILAVVFITEFIKKYFPTLMPNYKKWLTLLIAFFLMLVFIAWELILGNREQIIPFTQKILMSFPGVTTFYSYFLRPLLNKFAPKTNGNTPASE